MIEEVERRIEKLEDMARQREVPALRKTHSYEDLATPGHSIFVFEEDERTHSEQKESSDQPSAPNEIEEISEQRVSQADDLRE